MISNKELQGKLWSRAPHDWMKFVEPTFRPLYDEALNRLQLHDDQHLLDVGCGSGLFLLLARRTRVHIEGIDIAPGLLTMARKRLPGVSLLNQDLEKLPLNDESFDVVAGFNSFQYAASFTDAVVEAKRVLRKKGRLVIGTWGEESECELAPVFRAVTKLIPGRGKSLKGPFSLSHASDVREVCVSLGLADLYCSHISCPWQYFSIDDMIAALTCMAPCSEAVEAVGMDKVRAAIVQAAQPYKIVEEVFYFKNGFDLLIVEKI